MSKSSCKGIIPTASMIGEKSYRSISILNNRSARHQIYLWYLDVETFKLNTVATLALRNVSKYNNINLNWAHVVHTIPRLPVEGSEYWSTVSSHGHGVCIQSVRGAQVVRSIW